MSELQQNETEKIETKVVRDIETKAVRGRRYSRRSALNVS